MLSVVCWRWGTRYGVEYVNRMRSMLSRHLHLPHALFCVTDDSAGLDDGITPIPMWPADGLGRARRLRMFDPSVRAIFGDRILQLDIDGVIVGDITPLVDRADPFIVWRSVPEVKFVKSTGKLKANVEDGIGAYNTSMLLMDTGVMPTIWSDYLADPDGVERQAHKAGLWSMLYTTHNGKPTSVKPLAPGDDDQAVISLYAKRLLDPPIWREMDGVYKWGRRGFADKDALPENARVVFFNGSLNCNRPAGGRYDWIEKHWQ